ncbi:MAG: LPS export ABC transporter permease LptF [Deltaproteobacteria bacterium]|nr:LPS export ABC transporter permease LptF [Deltaproteobacteria bacterium]
MMQLKVQKYIFREVIVPMGLGIFVLSFVLIMGNLLKLTDLVINKGVAFKEIALLFLYIFPSFLDITLAMAFLLGILVGFGRLSADSEIIAMKASGVSITTMLKPVLVLGLIISLATGWLLLYARPLSRIGFHKQVFNIVNKRLTTGIQPMVFFHDFEGVVIYAENVDARSGKLKNIFLQDHRTSSSVATIFARHGTVRSNPKTLTFSINLEEGTILSGPGKVDTTSLQILQFAEYNIDMSFENEKSSGKWNQPKANYLTFPQMQKAFAGQLPGYDPHRLKIEWHKRFAMALAPLLFALIGVPLGIYSPRSGKIGGFVISLFIFLIYFVSSSFVETICRDADITFYGLIWLPDILFLLSGGILLYCAHKERDIFSFLPKFFVSRLFQKIQGLRRGKR